MIHALDLAQRRFALRHYDIKLLNFFLKKVDLEGKEDGAAFNSTNDDMVEIARYEEELSAEEMTLVVTCAAA